MTLHSPLPLFILLHLQTPVPNITSAYASANKDKRKNRNWPKPSPKDTHAQVFAFFEVLRAPSRSPAWSFPLTWAAKTMGYDAGRQTAEDRHEDGLDKVVGYVGDTLASRKGCTPSEWGYLHQPLRRQEAFHS